MTTDDRPERRTGPDRRRRPTRPWDCLTTPARRRRHRRAGAAGPRAAFVDRYPGPLGLLVLLLLALTLADGLITLHLMDHRCEEANPLMAPLIRRGPLPFLLTKYALTAAATPVLLLFGDYRLFRTRFRVGYLLPCFVGLYLVLLAYQGALLRAVAADAAAPAAARGARP